MVESISKISFQKEDPTTILTTYKMFFEGGLSWRISVAAAATFANYLFFKNTVYYPFKDAKRISFYLGANALFFITCKFFEVGKTLSALTGGDKDTTVAYLKETPDSPTSKHPYIEKIAALVIGKERLNYYKQPKLLNKIDDTFAAHSTEDDLARTTAFLEKLTLRNTILKNKTKEEIKKKVEVLEKNFVSWRMAALKTTVVASSIFISIFLFQNTFPHLGNLGRSLLFISSNHILNEILSAAPSVNTLLPSSLSSLIPNMSNQKKNETGYEFLDLKDFYTETEIEKFSSWGKHQKTSCLKKAIVEHQNENLKKLDKAKESEIIDLASSVERFKTRILPSAIAQTTYRTLSRDGEFELLDAKEMIDNIQKLSLFYPDKKKNLLNLIPHGHLATREIQENRKEKAEELRTILHGTFKPKETKHKLYQPAFYKEIASHSIEKIINTLSPPKTTDNFDCSQLTIERSPKKIIDIIEAKLMQLENLKTAFANEISINVGGHIEKKSVKELEKEKKKAEEKIPLARVNYLCKQLSSNTTITDILARQLIETLATISADYPKNEKLKDYLPTPNNYQGQGKAVKKIKDERIALHLLLSGLLPKTIKGQVFRLLDGISSVDNDLNLLKKLQQLDNYNPENKELKKYLPNSIDDDKDRKKALEIIQKEKATLKATLNKLYKNYSYEEPKKLQREIDTCICEIADKNAVDSTLREKIQKYSLTILKVSFIALGLLNSCLLLEQYKFSPPLRKVGTISKEFIGDFALYYIFKSCAENLSI